MKNGMLKTFRAEDLIFSKDKFEFFVSAYHVSEAHLDKVSDANMTTICSN